jgi:hypothetical protein
MNKTGSAILASLVLLQSVLIGHGADSNNEEREWQSLFNGNDLEGWEYRGKEKGGPTFSVEDGAIVGKTVMPYSRTAYLGSKQSFKNFELSLEVLIENGLNSGIQIRCPKKGAVSGSQIELHNGFHKTGYIWGQGWGTWVGQPVENKKTAFKSDEWNHIRAIVVGNNIKTWINGQAAADVTSDRFYPEGVIALQVHSYPRGVARKKGADKVLAVKWRNIKVRVLD